VSGPTTYVHGCDTAYVGSGCVLLLPPDAAGSVDDLWPLVRDGAGIDVVLEALAVRGMRAMGPFALLNGRRVVLRGSGRAMLLDTGQELTGAPFMTWAEHGVDDGQQIRLSVGDATDLAGGPELPIVAGVVRVASVTVPVDGAAPGPVPLAEPESAPGPVREPVLAPVPDRQPREVPGPEPVARVPDPSVSPETVAPDWTGQGAPAAQAPGLVDGIPDFGSPRAEETYDHLFGETVHRDLEEAGVRPVEPDPEGPVAALDTDHDGSTVLRADIAALRAGAPASGAPQVLGIRCPAGHGNPPASVDCRRCGASLPDVDPVPIPRPSLGRLCVSDGSQVELDRSVLIGRQPTASRFSAEELPHLLRVGGQQQDISRTHAEVRVEDWNVLVVDLSSNGTWLVRPGVEPQRLHRDEPVLVLPGSVLDLGDGVTIRYETGEP
jgi:hypothetical protein